MGGDISKRRKVLIAEDNQDCADVLAMLLKCLGYDVRVAYDGLEALDLAETFQPDAVLLDITLPKLNGFSVARRIRGYSWGPHVTLIAVTGWTNEQSRKSSQDAGIDHFLIKPVDPEHLALLLEGEPSLAD